MAQKELVYKIKVVDESGNVVDKAVNNIKELDEGVSGLQKKLNETSLGSKEFQELEKNLKTAKGALDDAKGSTMSLGEKFSSIPGPIGQVSQSVQGLGTAFKALIMNPVGAVIAAIAAVFIGLYKALTSTEEGVFKLNKVMGALSGVIDPVIRLAQNLANIFIDGLLKGIEGVQAALEFLGFDTIAQGSKDAEKLADNLNKVEEAEGDLEVERAKQNKTLAETREILADTNKTIGERKKALDKVKASEEALAKKEVELSKQRVANIKEEIRLKGASKELNDALDAAIIKQAQTEQEQAAVRRKNLKAEQALDKEAAAEAKAKADERKKQAEERKKEAEARLAYEKNINLLLIEDDRQREIKKAELDAEARAKEIEGLKFSEQKKKELLASSAELQRQAVEDINKKYDDAEDKKQEEKKKKDEADAKLLLDKEKATLDARLQLALMADEKDLERIKELLNKKLEIELMNSELSADQILLIRAQYAEQFTAIEKATTDAKKAEDQKKIMSEFDTISAYANAANQLAGIFGAETEAGKLASIAGIYLDTFAGAGKALNDETIPNTFLRIVAAASVIAAGLANVNKVLNVKTEIPGTKVSAKPLASGGIVQGQGSGTMDNVPVMLSPGESVMNARSTQMFSPLLSTLNQLGGGAQFNGGVVSNGVDTAQMALMGGIKNKNQQPVQAYVVSTQVTNQQMLERQTKSRSLI